MAALTRRVALVLLPTTGLVLALSAAPVASAASGQRPLKLAATYVVPGSDARPFGITIADKTHIAYIADADETSLSVLRIGGSRVHTVPEEALGTAIDGMTVNPRNGRAIIPVDQRNEVDYFQGTKRVRHMVIDDGDVPASNYQALYDAKNHLLYVTDKQLSAVHVFAGAKQLAVIALQGTLGQGDGPSFGDVDETNGRVYLPIPDTGAIDVISGTTLKQTLNTNVEGYATAIDARHGLAYTAGLAQGDTAGVGITNLRTSAQRFVPIDNATNVSVDAGTGLAYVSTRSGHAYVLRGAKTVATVPETTSPSANEPLGVDPSRHLAIIVGADRIHVLHKATVVETLPLPAKAGGYAVAAFDDSTGDAVVTEGLLNKIQVYSYESRR